MAQITDDEIKKIVRSIIATTLEISEDEVNPEITLEEQGTDSFAALEVLMELEDRFDVDITDAEAQRLYSFSSAVELIKELLARNEISE